MALMVIAIDTYVREFNGVLNIMRGTVLKNKNHSFAQVHTSLAAIIIIGSVSFDYAGIILWNNKLWKQSGVILKVLWSNWYKIVYEITVGVKGLKLQYSSHINVAIKYC